MGCLGVQLVEHHCGGKWVDGPVVACPRHSHQGRTRDLRPFAERNNVVVEGVAKTGQVSPKGTVAHREWFDGHVDANARPRPVSMKMSEVKRLANER